MSRTPETNRARPRVEAGSWLALIVLGTWTVTHSSWVAILAFVLAAVAWIRGRTDRGISNLAPTLLLVGSVSALGLHYSVHRIESDWEGVWSAKAEQVREVLVSRVEATIDRGIAAADRAAELDGRDPNTLSEADLERIRRDLGMTAVAIYDSTGTVLRWTGEHKGRVPDEVRSGLRSFAFWQGPLFRYQYFSTPMADGSGVALAVALMQEDLPRAFAGPESGLRSWIHTATGVSVDISRLPLIGSEADAIEFRRGEEVLFYATIQRPSQNEVRSSELKLWTNLLSLLVLAALGILAVAAAARPRGDPWLPITVLALAAILPFGPLLGLSRYFDPTLFMLPGPIPLSLGRIAALASGALLVLGWTGLPEWNRGHPLLAGAVVGVGFPFVAWLFQRAATVDLLALGTDPWLGYEFTLAAVFCILTALGFAVGGRGRRRPRLLLTWLAIGAVVGLMLTSVWVMAGEGADSLLLVALWSLPVGLAAIRLNVRKGWDRSASRWLLSVFFAATAALSIAWGQRLESRIAYGDREIDRLAERADPYLGYLMYRLAEVVEVEHRSWLRSVSEDGAEMLYRGWVESGLADAGYPVRLTLWSARNVPEEVISIGVDESSPDVSEEFLTLTRAQGESRVLRWPISGYHMLLLVPLADGSVFSALVPPAWQANFITRPGALYSFITGGAPGDLTLVPLQAQDVREDSEFRRWERIGRGWHGEGYHASEDVVYDVHYDVEIAGPSVLVARSTLVLVLNGAVLLLLWGSGRTLASDRRPPVRDWIGLLTTFRARVTLALIAFFLLSIAIFSAVAFRTIASAAVRASTLLAEKVVEEGASSYRAAGGSMVDVARRVGAEVLEYRDGSLREGSVDELVELGIYDGWLPSDVHRALQGREESLISRTGALGSWEYGVAYGRLPDGDVIAAYVPLTAGADAVRISEVLHLIGFAVVMGSALSLLLAFYVARALTRPIQTLRVASERVGTGNLRVRLPEGRTDEFGSVFSAFNRMVSGVRKARRALVRSTNRTRAVVRESATGVIAIDREGRVLLVNPKAELLLEGRLTRGHRLASGASGEVGEFADWLMVYLRGGADEADAEFTFSERRIRVRASRISGRGAEGGAVINLEDVTDELRSERILAWGEMAQQVAHEVKNPLTPIRLSVQHILRAWEDDRNDFEGILERNVDAVLKEIDRLAGIANSFSRLGPPGEGEDTPAEGIVLIEVVREVIALYSGGEGPVAYMERLPEGLPRVQARETELKEVLLNLFENAREAIGSDGAISVDAERSDDGYLHVHIRDDGVGIPEHHLQRVFEPQFSTRTKGTGLGLAIVRRVVESWEGTVSVQSVEGEGTVITLRLRVWEPESDAPSTLEP